MCDEGEAREVDEWVGVLSRSEQRATNDLVPLMPPNKAEYVFGGLPEFMCRVVCGLLPDIKVGRGAV